MRRVRIKKYPKAKRKVRIKKMPGLPQNVGYGANTQFVFQHGGLKRFIPSYNPGGGVEGGIDSPVTKNYIPNWITDPVGVATGEVEAEGVTQPDDNKVDKGLENYTETIKLRPTITDGQSAALQGIDKFYMAAGIGQALNRPPNEGQDLIRYGDVTMGNTERIRTGDHNINSGLKNEDMMGAKILNVTQLGGALPRYNKAGSAPVAMVNGQPMTQEQVNAWLEANPGKANQVKWLKTRKEAYDEGYYDTKDKNVMARGVQNELEYDEADEANTSRMATTAAEQAAWKKGLCDSMKPGGSRHHMKPADVAAEHAPAAGESFVKFLEQCSGRKATETVETIILEDDTTPCPDCPEGTVKGTPTIDEPCPCVEPAPDDSSTSTACPCPGDPPEGPFTGVIIMKPDGSKECECTGVNQDTTSSSSYESAPEFWLQDTIKTAGLAADLATLKKYMPQKQAVDLEERDVSFVDPTRELAANAEQANIAAQAASSFAGPQSTGRLSAIQGKGAAGNADIMNRYNQQNLQIGNKALADNAAIRNQEALQNAKFAQQYYDQTTIANQQYDNSKRAMKNALRDQFANSITNMMQTDAMNQMYPNYAVDAGSGGKMNFTGNDGRQLSPTYEQDIEDYEKAYLSRGIDPTKAAELALKRANAKLVGQPSQQAPPSGAYAGYPGGRVSQFGGSIYEHGGEHANPFGSENMSQIQPTTYTTGVNSNSISFGSQTTSSIGKVPRDNANLEAEGGETIFGDINGDGFPETNKIVGPRHSEGGVPLNLPEDTFIYSDYKRKSMKISDPNVLKMFGKSAGKKGKKKSYTPAELAKQYDVNKYRALLQDPNSDNITKRTAELMIENYNMKLGALALVQESSKGFPQGIPTVAKPYMEDAGITEEQLIPKEQQPQTVQRPQQPMSFSDAEILEESTS